MSQQRKFPENAVRIRVQQPADMMQRPVELIDLHREWTRQQKEEVANLRLENDRLREENRSFKAASLTVLEQSSEMKEERDDALKVLRGIREALKNYGMPGHDEEWNAAEAAMDRKLGIIGPDEDADA